MYGTVAKMKFKPGAEQQMASLMKEYETLKIPGHVATHVYRMDQDSNEFYMAVIFADKDAYHKNAQDPTQDARYRKMRDLLAADPEWHDGEIVYSSNL